MWDMGHSKYIIFFTVSGFNWFCFLLTISPHLENNFWHGTEDADMHKNVLASL